MQSDRELSQELVLAAVDLMGRSGRDGTVRVQGASMLPTLRPGQLLAVDFAPDRFARGDLLVFRQGGILLVHRLLGPARPLDGRRRLRTRGDGVLELDPPVELFNVVGRVTAMENGDRWLSTRRRAARLYARLLALHDFFWAGVNSVFRRVDRRLAARKISFRFRLWILAVDRFNLRWVHRALFALAHREVPAPVSDPDAGGRASA